MDYSVLQLQLSKHNYHNIIFKVKCFTILSFIVKCVLTFDEVNDMTLEVITIY